MIEVSMRRRVTEYASTLVVMLALDSVWLSLTVPALYQPRLAEFLRPDPDLVAAILFYLLYAAGTVVFAVAPARHRSPTFALRQGAFLGVVAYATYDLTNQATLRGWPILITILDIGWGAILTGTAAAGASWITRRWASGHS
jgi:uncharacterized membrane protein